MSLKTHTCKSAPVDGEIASDENSPELTSSTRASSMLGEKDDTEIGNDGPKRKIHSLVLLDSEMMSTVADRPKTLVSLDLSEGENWLQLPSQRRSSDEGDSDDSFLDENQLPRILSSSTASTTAVSSNTQQQPDFWMLSSTEPSVLEDSALNCFLCFDVDGTYLTIKDMRMISQNEGGEGDNDDDEDNDDTNTIDWIVSLRRGTRTNYTNDYNVITTNSPNSTTSSKSFQLSNLEPLSRRQLRILYHKDCIIVQRSNNDKKVFAFQHLYAASMNESNDSQLSLENCINNNDTELIINHDVGFNSKDIKSREDDSITDNSNVPSKSNMEDTDADVDSSKFNNNSADQSLPNEMDGVNLLTQPTESTTDDIISTGSPNTIDEQGDAPNNNNADEIIDEIENSEDDSTVDPDETPLKIRANFKPDLINLNEKIQQTISIRQEEVVITNKTKSMEKSVELPFASKKLDVQNDAKITDSTLESTNNNLLEPLPNMSSDEKDMDTSSMRDKMETGVLKSDECADADGNARRKLEAVDATQDLESMEMQETLNKEESSENQKSDQNPLSTPRAREKDPNVVDKDGNEDDGLTFTEKFSESLLSPSLSSRAKSTVKRTIPNNPEHTSNESSTQINANDRITTHADNAESREHPKPIVIIEAIPSKMDVDVDDQENQSDATRTVDPGEIIDVVMEINFSNNNSENQESRRLFDNAKISIEGESNKLNEYDEKFYARDNKENEIINDDVALPKSKSIDEDKGDTTMHDCQSCSTKEELYTKPDPEAIKNIDTNKICEALSEDKSGSHIDINKVSISDKHEDVPSSPPEETMEPVDKQNEESLFELSKPCNIKTTELVDPNSTRDGQITDNKAQAPNSNVADVDGPRANATNFAQTDYLNRKGTNDGPTDTKGIHSDLEVSIVDTTNFSETKNSMANGFEENQNTTQHKDVRVTDENIVDKVDACLVALSPLTDKSINTPRPDENSSKTGGNEISENDKTEVIMKELDKVCQDTMRHDVLVQTGLPNNAPTLDTNDSSTNKTNSSLCGSSSGTGKRRKSIIGPSSVVASKSFETDSSHTCDIGRSDVQASERSVSPVPSSMRKRKGAATKQSEVSQWSISPVSESASGKRNQKKRKLDISDDFSASERTEASTTSKRTKQSSSGECDTEQVRIIVTGFELTQSQKNKLRNIKAVLLNDVDDAHTATHAIVTDGIVPIRRTPKLMIALCRTPNIVTSDWIIQSIKENKALPCEKFLALNDEKAEKQYNFSLSRTIDRIEFNRNAGKFLLSGWSVFFCKGVAGNKAPPEKELRLIIEAADGKWLSSLKSLSGNVLIITSDPEPKKQISSKDVHGALQNGAIKKTTTWLFHILMTQELDL